MDAAAIYMTLQNHYGTLTNADMHAFKADLQVPYVQGDSFSDYTHKQRRIHKALADANQAISASDQVLALRLGTAHVPALLRKAMHWADRHDTVASQTWDSLATALQAAIDNPDPLDHLLPTTTAYTGGVSGRANAAGTKGPTLQTHTQARGVPLCPVCNKMVSHKAAM